MKHGGTIATALGIAIIILVASCGGGGGNRSLTEGITTPPPATTDASEDNAAPYASPSPYTEAPRTVTDTEYVLVKSGDTVEEFAPIAAKFGYEVEYKNGNWLKVRVPDGNIDYAITELRKEYTVFDVQPLRHYIMPREECVPDVANRSVSFLNNDVMYSDLWVAPSGKDGEGNVTYTFIFGQRGYFAPMSFEGAWDIALRPDVATQDVTIAVIDAGIWYDPANPDWTIHPDSNSARLVTDYSGYVAEDGTFTQGDYSYEVDGEGNPYRSMGQRLVGMLLADWAGSPNENLRFNWELDDPPDGTDVTTMASMAPVAPNANIMVIKTGALNVDQWEFTSQHIASAITHAATNGANIILIGWWTAVPIPPPVPPDLQDAINDAFTNYNAVIIAPAGNGTYNDGGTPTDPSDDTFDGIGPAAGINPSGGDNVLSVGAVGYIRANPDTTDEGALGFFDTLAHPTFHSPWWDKSTWRDLTPFSNTDPDIAGVGYAWSWNNTIPTDVWFSLNYGTEYAAAYVAGAASMVHQALNNANGAPPTAQEVVNALVDEALTVNGGVRFLTAGKSVALANNGGYNKIIEPVSIGLVGFPGGVGEFHNFGEYGDLNAAYIETGQPIQMYAQVSGSDEPFKLRIFWGDEAGSTYPDTGEFTDYNSGDPIDFAGYAEPISSVIVFQAQDALENVAQFSIPVVAYNGLSVDPDLMTIDEQPVNPGELVWDEVYLMDSGASYPVLQGNTVTFDWDFDWDGAPANFTVDPVDVADRENVLFSYGDGTSGTIQYLNKGPVDNTKIGLRVTQTLRPTLYFVMVDGVTAS